MSASNRARSAGSYRMSDSQRVRPIMQAALMPVFSSICSEMLVKRSCSSCSQYQSDDTSTSARMRASASRNSACTSRDACGGGSLLRTAAPVAADASAAEGARAARGERTAPAKALRLPLDCLPEGGAGRSFFIAGADGCRARRMEVAVRRRVRSPDVPGCVGCARLIECLGTGASESPSDRRHGAACIPAHGTALPPVPVAQSAHQALVHAPEPRCLLAIAGNCRCRFDATLSHARAAVGARTHAPPAGARRRHDLL